MLPNPMQTPPIGGMAPMNTTPPMNMMPPMPPMGKMPPMEMNLDPMARQNFNNLMSGIQSQSIIPPMPMRMNKGGSVNPLSFICVMLSILSNNFKCIFLVW